MVQGNWERRAEMSETRRLEAKQRKQRNGERKVFKAQGHDLMSFLNRNAVNLFRSDYQIGEEKDQIIHVWTDTPPCAEDGSPLHHRLWEEEHSNKKRNNKHDDDNEKHGRRGRSSSFETGEGVRSAKNYRNTGHKKKKVHPRSKESSTNNSSNNGDANENVFIHKLELCRSHFFFGKGKVGSKKRGGSGGKKSFNCRSTQHPKNYLTINDVLLPVEIRNGNQETSNSHAQGVLCSAESSYPESEFISLYYSSFCINELLDNHSDAEQLSSISHLIVDAMAKQSCNIGSIVYFAVGNQLLYDRYRKGIIVEEGEIMRLRKNKTPSKRSGVSDDKIQSMSLSSSILEHILTFLDDSAVASMSSVSRSWNQEIGKQSGNLWRHLLERHSWPVPTLNQVKEEEVLAALRESFVSHYTVVRDINGIKKGIDCLISRKSMNEFDGSVRSFESVKNSPQARSHCVAVKIWAQNRALAAYHKDCSLRLFDSIEGSESSGERLCRELICHCVDPYKTKKRNCQLIAIALDTDFIGCLLRVVDGFSEHEKFILTVLSREDFLIGDELNDDVMQVIDIRQSILNFLLSCDYVDHGLLQLHDFLANDGDLDEIEVVVSQSLVECGYGRFMVEVAIAIPSNDIVDEQESVDIFIFRKLFLFSTSVGAITWMSDSCPSSTPLGSINEEMTLCSLKMTENDRSGYNVVSLASVAPTITTLSIDPGGNLNHSTLIQGTNLVRNEILVDHWSVGRSQKRPVLMLEHELVVADNLVSNESGTRKSVVTFYPMDDDCGRSTIKKLDLVGNLEVCHLVLHREAHIIAICRVFESTSEDNDVDGLIGNWFGPDASPIVSSHAIVIDLQSRSEIYRVCLVDNLGLHLGIDSMGLSPNDGEFSIQLAVHEDTVVAGLSSKGIIMTGADARKARASVTFTQENLTTPLKSAKKAKKKKNSKKNGKKDGFARGQKM